MACVAPSGWAGQGSLGLSIVGDYACMYAMADAPMVRQARSYDPSYAGSQEETTRFVPENGEMAEVPRDTVIPKETAYRVFEHLFLDADFRPEIAWV
jgi:hypothetical protein